MTLSTVKGSPLVWLGLTVVLMTVVGLARTGARAQSTPVVYLDPPEQQVQLGSPATLVVRIRDVEDLAGYQFSLAFPPSVSFSAAELGPFLGSTGRTARSFPPLVEPGKVTLVAISSGAGPGASGGGVLATVRLTLDEGNAADITVTGALLTDTTGQQRTEARTEGARLRSGPPPTATRRPDQLAFLPMVIRNVAMSELPVAPTVKPLPSSPTPLPPSPTPAVASPTATQPNLPTATATTTGPAPTVPPSPTTGKPEPIISELQCYGRHEWVKVTNPSGQALELENWTVRSTQGGEVFKIKDALSLKPAEVLTVHSGSGAPKTEDRLNLLWTETPRWNEVDGDTAELTAPFPSSKVVSTMSCATATPRAQ